MGGYSLQVGKQRDEEAEQERRSACLARQGAELDAVLPVQPVFSGDVAPGPEKRVALQS